MLLLFIHFRTQKHGLFFKLVFEWIFFDRCLICNDMIFLYFSFHHFRTIFFIMRDVIVMMAIHALLAMGKPTGKSWYFKCNYMNQVRRQSKHHLLIIHHLHGNSNSVKMSPSGIGHSL